ncbi:MAG: hypothetical protein ACXWCS_25160, partial [Burkholderiales bacterium]
MLKSSASELTPPRRRELALAFVLLAPLVAVFLAVPRIAQDSRYHAFADTRTLLGAPNFANVASNLPFLIIGAAGQLINCGVGSVGNLLIMSGHEKRLMKVQIAMAAVMTIGSAALV